jgi:hypothetical protein
LFSVNFFIVLGLLSWLRNVRSLPNRCFWGWRFPDLLNLRRHRLFLIPVYSEVTSSSKSEFIPLKGVLKRVPCL